MHYLRLVYRGSLFIWALVMWILNPQYHTMRFDEGKAIYDFLFIVIWFVFAAEMISRFFPSYTESMGCQKQFARNYKPTGKEPDIKKLNKGVIAVIISWVLLNGAIAGLHALKIISDGILILVTLFYSVCDMICILFFCPFQTLMMKNRCCTTCRIYNWDFLMMFTPCIFIPSIYTWSLVLLALALFIRWEVTFKLHPERFTDDSNESVKCINCKEKLCAHKKQLAVFWKYEHDRLKQLAEKELKELNRR